jgi:hypothetical protein
VIFIPLRIVTELGPTSDVMAGGSSDLIYESLTILTILKVWSPALFPPCALQCIV